MNESAADRLRMLMASAALLAGGDIASPAGLIKLRLDKESCTSCGAKLPPGRGGRRCGSCREQEHT